jgi:hypothetical protein
MGGSGSVPCSHIRGVKLMDDRAYFLALIRKKEDSPAIFELFLTMESRENVASQLGGTSELLMHERVGQQDDSPDELQFIYLMTVLSAPGGAAKTLESLFAQAFSMGRRFQSEQHWETPASP